MKLFDLNSPLMLALSKMADVVICNIMFCLFSLPIFTAGASLAALFTCMQQLISEDEQEADGLIFRTFWRAFKQNFKQATLLWLICLLAFAFLGMYYWITQRMEGSVGKLYQITFYVLLLVFLFGFQYIFPLQARYQNKIRFTLRNAWLISIAALPWTVLSMLVVIAAVYLTFFLRPDGGNMAIYLWAVCGFGVVAYLDSFFFRRAFRKMTPERLMPESTKPSDAVFTDEEHREQDLMVQESRYSAPEWNRREDLFPSEQPATKNRKRKR